MPDEETPICDKQIMVFGTTLRSTEPFEIVAAEGMLNNEGKCPRPAVADYAHSRARSQFRAGNDEPLGPKPPGIYIARVPQKAAKRSNDRRKRQRTPLGPRSTEDPAWIGTVELIATVELGAVQRS